MGTAKDIWIADIKREHLIDFLEGDGPVVNPISAAKARALEIQPGRILAVWKGAQKGNFTPMPQLLVGDRPTLEDLFAWGASYLRGLGPITAQSRALSPEQFRTGLQRMPSQNWWQVAPGAVGLVIGEVLMHVKRAVAPSEVSIAACRGTLSFGLLRAAALGVPHPKLDEVAQCWSDLRLETGQTDAITPVQEVVGIVRELTRTGSDRRPIIELANQRQVESWYGSLLGDGDSVSLLREVGAGFPEIRDVSSWYDVEEKTAEERVRVFDAIAPEIVGASDHEIPERGFLLALLALTCRPGFPQQVSLLEPSSSELSSSALWLGAMQAVVPLTEALSLGDGLGWRLAREIFRVHDIFAVPQCDVSFSELKVLMRGKSKLGAIKSFAKERLDVEIQPGVSVLVRNSLHGAQEQPNLPLEAHPKSGERPIRSRDALVEAERALEAALRQLRVARWGQEGGQRTRSNRKKAG